MTDARELTFSLKGRWHGEYGAAPCPVCQPTSRRTQNALTPADGKTALLLHCKRSGCDFRNILAAAGLGSGDYSPSDPGITAKRIAKAKADALRKHEAAKRLWQECQPITGTIAETYLRFARYLTLSLAMLARAMREPAACDGCSGGRRRRLRNASHLFAPRWQRQGRIGWR